VAELHVLRQHTLGLPGARKIAFQWAEQAETEFGMSCTYEEGQTVDEVCFERSGVNGTLTITHEKFELNAKLGFLLGAFKGAIEQEIVKNLDELLQAKPKSKSRAKAASEAPTKTPKQK
jgi:putative polyhydroxyalkanoate system protein